MEDAYKLKLLSFEEVSDLLTGFLTDEEVAHSRSVLEGIADRNEQIAYLRSKAINRLVAEAAKAFVDEEENILSGGLKHSLIQVLAPRQRLAYERAIKTAYAKIYSSHAVVDVELAGHRIFAELIERMMFALENPHSSYSRSFLKRVSSQYNTEVDSTYGRLLTTLDYISGMTDLYALDLYRTITGMNLPHI